MTDSRQFWKVNVLFLLHGFLLVKFFHELEVVLIAIFDGFLLFDDSGLLFKGMRSAPLEFEVADYPAGGGILRLEPVGADKLVERMHARGDVISHF